MRHAKRVKKLGRTKSHRKAMLANMASSLFMYHMIKTTQAKAKEVKKLAEKLITLGKRGDLHAHRQVYDVIRDRKLVKKIFEEIAPKFSDRRGGYTRVVRLGVRRGDGAELSVVELLVEKPPKEEKKGKKEKAGRKAKPEKAKEVKAKKTAGEDKTRATADQAAPQENSAKEKQGPGEEKGARSKAKDSGE